jgi:hypothetical protein
MRIDSSGNVGIGTSLPTQKLTIEGAMNLRNGSRAGAFEIDSSGNLWVGTATTAGSIIFESGHTTTGLPSTGGERARIDSDGLKFNGDTAAANALDDYEEGAWTASLTTTGTGFGGVSYALNTGRYVKIGRLVNISLRFITSAVTIGPATSNVILSGLPFASSGDSTSSPTNGFNANWGSNAPNFGVVFNSSTIINLYRYPASGVIRLDCRF